MRRSLSCPLAVVATAVLLTGCAGRRATTGGPPATNVVPRQIAESVVLLCGIPFVRIENGASNRRYLLIHGDEETARQVLRDHIAASPGIAHLAAGQGRYVALDSGRLDPNRMFSAEGAEKNLRLLNPEWAAEKVKKEIDWLEQNRTVLVESLLPPGGGLLLALHNNTSAYSVLDEAKISNRVSLKDPEHLHDFFLCTSEGDFQILSRSPYNVVLQNAAGGEDDGSLSRLAARRATRYVNIEVSLGNVRQQKQMLAWSEKNLP